MEDQSSNIQRDEAINKLRELMKNVRFCMLTTIDSDGGLRSRPMALQQTEFDGDLWFFTGKSTEKVDEIQEHRQVNVSFSDPKANVYVSVSGRARLVEDRQKAEELWNIFHRTWFPKGVDDPDLILMKVEVEKAEYWDSPNSAVVHLYGLAKAMITGQSPNPGEHEKLTVERL